MADYTTRVGAEWLSLVIRQYGATTGLGHAGLRVWAQPTRAAGWVIRSNLSRGLLPPAAS